MSLLPFRMAKGAEPDPEQGGGKGPEEERENIKRITGKGWWAGEGTPLFGLEPYRNFGTSGPVGTLELP